MKPLYVMLIGLPAAGKTTLRNRIVEAYPGKEWCHVSTDDYIDGVAAKQSATYNDVFQSVIDVAQKAMNAELQAVLSTKRNILHDQTNLTVKSRAKKLSCVPKIYLKIGLLVQTDAEERETRLANRPGKKIPLGVDQKMILTYEEPTLNEFDVFIHGCDCLEALRYYV